MDDRGATVELQPVERSRRGAARPGGRSRACEIKNHDDDAIDRLFRAANGYPYRARVPGNVISLERYKIHNRAEDYLDGPNSRIRDLSH